MTAYFSRLQSFLPAFFIERLTEFHIDTFIGIFVNNMAYWKLTQGRPVTARDFMDTVCYCPKNFEEYKAYCIGIREDAMPVAVLSLLEDYPREGVLYIGLLLVDKTLQRKRVGSNIMAGIENACEGMFDTIQLSFQSNNFDALRFWERQGFLAEDRPIEKETDNLTMRKRLTRSPRKPENEQIPHAHCWRMIRHKKQSRGLSTSRLADPRAPIYN